MLLYFWRYVVPNSIDYTENPPYFECIRIIDTEISVLWVERYQIPGECEIVIPATTELLSMFWQNEIMITRSDTDKVMFVEDVFLTVSAESGDQIRITGTSGEGLTRRRVIEQRGAITNFPATNAVHYYVQENLGSYWYYHTDEDHQHGRHNPYCRKYVNVFVYGGDDESITDVISAEPFGKNLCDFITEICAGSDFGFQVVFDDTNLVLKYGCYRGVDRSLNQSERNAVVFSDDFRNLGNNEYHYSRKTYCSHVIAGGSGTGDTREYGESFKAFRFPSGCGLNLREKFVNASGTSGNMLRMTAENEVLAARETVEFTAEAAATGQFKFRSDYHLGDKVSVVNRYGISGTAVVVEVVETEDANGAYTIPTLGMFDVQEYYTPIRPEKPELYQGITIYPENQEPVQFDNFPDAYQYLRENSSIWCNITIGNMFSSIPSNAFPSWANIGDVSIFDGVTSIEDRAFYSYSSMKSITLPNTMTRIGVSAFYRCQNITQLVIPGSVTTIEDSAFNSCHKIETVVINRGVTAIPARCFQYCEELHEITIPDTIETIGDYAFYYCQSLTTITIPKPQDSIPGAPWGAPNAQVIWTG